MRQIHIVLIEDSPAYRSVIANTLGSEPDITPFHQFGTAEIALRHLQGEAESDAPDIILLDLSLPGMSGMEALPWIRKYMPKTKIIILTESDKEADIAYAIAHGASGYLLKSNTLDQVIDGIRTVMNGGASLDPSVAKIIISTLHKYHPVESKDSILSQREMAVLCLISEGLQKKEVAKHLKISTRTVAAHVEKIYQKLHVKNAPAAVSKAYQLGLFRS